MRYDLVIKRGEDFRRVIQWMTDPLVHKPVAELLSRSPFRLRVTEHGLPPDWLVAVPGVSGGCCCALAGAPLPFYRATVLNDDVIELPGVDATLLPTYLRPEQIAYKTPMELESPPGTPLSGALEVRAGADDRLPVLLALTTGNGGMEMHPDIFQIMLQMPEAQVDALPFRTGAHRLIVTDGHTPERVLEGRVTVEA